jgi:hypothetical protein
MSLAANSWESSPLVGLIGVAVGAIAVLATVWAAMYASRPRRGLAYTAEWGPPGELMAWVTDIVPNVGQQHRAVITLFSAAEVGSMYPRPSLTTGRLSPSA